MDAVIADARIANQHDFVMEDLPDQYETLIGEQGVQLSGGSASVSVSHARSIMIPMSCCWTRPPARWTT